MGRVLKAAYEDLFLCVFMSIAWWIGLLPIVTIAPVTMATNHVANRIANYKRVDNSFFWEALRQHIGRGWLMMLITLGAPAAVLFNIWFYANSQGYLRVIGVAWLWMLLLVLMISQYFIPLFWQQDEPSIKLALRNATILALKHPLYTLLILLFQLVLLALSVGLTLPLVLLWPALAALTGNFALTGLLQEMGLAPEPPEAPIRG
ncbi:MAG: hypothetical protein DYG89_52515 [Caldilinea sp. CFX5]|nr:hypothetical protein [Caldilinea sp. CFX5]